MKTFFKKTLIALAILLSATITTNLIHEKQAYATYSCRDFLGLTSWDCNLKDDWTGNDRIVDNVLIIITNVSNDLLVLVAYLVLGFVIYGGYLYMFASGDPSKTAAGKKTLTRAFIGLAIVMLSKIIVNTLHIAFLGGSGAFSGDCAVSECVAPSDLVDRLVGWVIGISGVVAAVFLVVGAVGYLTSTGDPNKTKKAKDTIMYALIGLAVVGLAQIITAFVTSTIRNSSQNSYINTTIAKELK